MSRKSRHVHGNTDESVAGVGPIAQDAPNSTEADESADTGQHEAVEADRTPEKVPCGNCNDGFYIDGQKRYMCRKCSGTGMVVPPRSG